MAVARPRLWDLTLPLSSSTCVYPGDPVPTFRRRLDRRRGDALNYTSLELGMHVGTHLDAPSHFLDEAGGTDSFSLQQLIGPARIVDLTEHEWLAADVFASLEVREGWHLLLKTRNSQLWQLPDFEEGYLPIEPEAADRILSLKPASIGFDYYSLDSADSTHFPVHCAFAEAQVPVVVALDLRHVPAGDYWYVCLPLPVVDCDGAPVRAIVLDALPSLSSIT